jgi:hypothetical protein
MKKDLLAGRPGEIFTTINTLDWPVFELHLLLTPFPVRCDFNLWL